VFKIDPLNISSGLKHELNDAHSTLADCQPEVFYVRPKSVLQQDFNQAVEVSVDGSA
jgi:hypothetical protein